MNNRTLAAVTALFAMAFSSVGIGWSSPSYGIGRRVLERNPVIEAMAESKRSRKNAKRLRDWAGYRLAAHQSLMVVKA